jgi:hypothetical protein
MSADAPPPGLDARVRTMQIITVAIVLGPVNALVIFLYLRTQNPPQFADAPLLTYIAAGFAAVMAVGQQIAAGAAAAAGRRRAAAGGQPAGAAGPAGDWYALYMTCLLVRLAALEGATFFLVIVYYLEGTPLSLLLAVVLIVALALHFPTAPRVERWVETQRQLAEQGRLT